MRNFGIITNFILTQNTQGSRLPLAGQNGPRGFLSFLHGLITLSSLSKTTMNGKRTNWRGYNRELMFWGSFFLPFLAVIIPDTEACSNITGNYKHTARKSKKKKIYNNKSYNNQYHRTKKTNYGVQAPNIKLSSGAINRKEVA